MTILRCRIRFTTTLLAATAAVLGPAAPVFAQAQVAPAGSPTSPVIDGVEVNADAALAAGSTLDLTVRGTPHGRASVLLPGSAGPLVLREADPGVYVGHYTVRDVDHIDPEGAIRTSVAAGARTTIARFRFPPSFRTTESAAVRPVVPIAAAPAHAPTVPQSTATMGAAAVTATPLSLQVLQPTAGTLVTASSGLLIEGRTAPNALVRTRIDAVPPVVPGRASVAQIVMEETVQADADGRFRISLGPQRAVPGTQFEIGLRATRGEQSTPEQRLVAVQGQG
jgi:hypothetical protein